MLPNLRPSCRASSAILLCLGSLAWPAAGQGLESGAEGWRRCSTITVDSAERLACFDRWAGAQAAPRSASALVPAPATPSQPPIVATAVAAAPAEPAGTGLHPGGTCRSGSHSSLSRLWELEPGSSCGTFGIRGYRPISLSWIGSDSVNTAPSTPAAGHTAAYRAYETSEMRIQLSVRTKIAQGMLTDGDMPGRDSLWFGYTQQSYWQLFNAGLSRPFRSTDHEPELTYVYPTDALLPGGWRLRYSGLSAVHQSNGQSLPLSRSWNRVVLMAGLEKDSRFTLQARAWARLPERHTDDDNPDISDYIGRAELTGSWQVNRDHHLALTVRHSLRDAARGSVRLDWLYRIGSPQADGDASGLRLHTQFFSGYGDSLLDYNRRRKVLSVGLSLVDF